MAAHTVVATWADGTGRWIVFAFSELVRAVFAGRVSVEPRVEGAPVVAGSTVIGVHTAQAYRLVPDAVAVMSSSGGIFGFAGQDPAGLRRTGDGAATLADVRRKTAMRDVIHTLAVAAGVDATAIDARFEEAWPHYERALAGLRPPPAAPLPGRRLKAAGVVLVIAGACLALAWGVALWPFEPAAGPCAARDGRDLAECEWALFVKRHSTRGSSGNVALATQLQHRPFAIVERRTGCGQGSTVEEHHLVIQGDAVHGARIGIVAGGPPGLRYPAPPAITVTLGDRTDVVAPWECAGTPPDVQPPATQQYAIRPRYIGALSPSDICRSLQAVRNTIPVRTVVPDQPGAEPLPVTEHLLAGYLAANGAGPRAELQQRLSEWATRCDVR